MVSFPETVDHPLYTGDERRDFEFGRWDLEAGESLLRVDGVESETGIEDVRDVLDELGVEYEHVRSEPEDSYPRTIYFSVAFGSEEEVERLVGRLAEEHGYDAEVI